MIRKVNKIGPATLMVSLPAKWAKEFNVKQGDELNLNLEGNSLIISPEKNNKIITKTEIDCKKYNERSLINILFQAYRKGFDEIKLKYNSEVQLKDIKKTVKKLLGFEITNIKNNLCTIQNIAEPSDEKFFIILRKIFYIIKEEASLILEDIKNNKFDFEARLETKADFDRYTNYIRRVIIKTKAGGDKDSYLLFFLCSQLSYIEHAYFYLHKLFENNKTKLDNKVIKIIEDVNELFNKLNESFYKKDMDLASEIGIDKENILNKEIFGLMSKSKGFESVVLYRLGELTRLIHLSSTILFGLLEYEVE